ncbi:MAG: succinate dehydrogenase, partial [Chryseotalea sp.]
MNWLITLFTSTLGRKLLMALTGLFLILFLAVHLIGNLQLLKDDGG